MFQMHLQKIPCDVLRVARFAARYASYGFEIAENLQLMKRIANSGELNALTPERVWKETSRYQWKIMPISIFKH